MDTTTTLVDTRGKLSTGAYLESLINERENQRVYIPIERDIFDGRRLLTAKFGSIFPSDSYAMRDVLRKELDIAFMADEGEVIPTEYQPFLEYIQSLNPDENRYLMLQFISEYELREKMFKIMERRIRCIQIKGRGEMSTEQRNDLARYIMDAEDDVLALGIELEFLHLSKGQIYLRLKRTIGRDAELRAIDQRCDVLYSQIDLAKLRRLLQENYDQFERVFQMSAQVCAVDGEEIVNDSDPDESSEEGNDDAGDEHIEEARPPRREARERRYNEVQAKDAAICKHRGQGNMDKVGLKRRREGRAGTATSGRSGDGIIVEKGGTMGIGDIRGRKRRISTVESHVRVAVNARSVSAVMGSCMGVHYRSSEDTMLRRFSNGGAGLNIAAACSACCRHLLYTRIMNDKTKEVLETLRLTLTGYAVDNLYEKVIETALDWIFEPNINFSIVLDIIVALFSDTIVMDSIERVQFFLTGLEAFDELLLSKLCSPFDLTTEIIEYWTAISSSLETWIVAHNHQNSADLNGWRARVQAMLYRVSPKFFSLLITHALEGLDDDSLPSRFLRLLVWTTPYTPIEGAAQIHRYHTHWSHLTPIFTSMYDNDGHAWRFITLHSFILMVSTYDQESDARRITANWLQISRMDLEFSVSRSRCTYLACVWDDPSTCFKLLFHDPITPKAPGSDAWELTKPDYKPMMRLLETIVLDGMVHSADPDEMQAMVSAVFLGHGLSDLKHSWLGHAAQLIHNAFSPPAYPDQTLLKFVRTYFMKMPSDLSDSCRTKVSSFSWQEVLLMAATASGVLSMQNFRSDMLTPLDVLHFIRLFCSETKRSFVADYGGVILWTFTALFLLPSLSLHGSLLVKVLEALIQCIQGGGGSHLVNVLMLFMLTSIALKEFSHISQFPFQDNPELIHVLRHVLLFANNFEILFFDGDISIYLNSLILQAQIVQFLSSAAVSKMTETLSESTFDDIHLAVGRLVSFVNGNDVIIKSAALPLPKERILQMHNKIIPSLSSSCLLCITVSKIQSLKQEKRSLCIRLAESLLSSLGARETQVLDAKLKCSFYSHFIRMSLNLIERSSALMNIVCFSALKCADKILGSFFEVVFTAVKSTEADIFSHSEADALLSSLLQFIPIIREGFSTRGSVSLTATIMMAALEMIPIFHQKTTKFPGLISLSVEFLAAFSSKSITTLGGGQREVYKKALMEFSLSLVRAFNQLSDWKALVAESPFTAYNLRADIRTVVMQLLSPALFKLMPLPVFAPSGAPNAKKCDNLALYDSMTQSFIQEIKEVTELSKTSAPSHPLVLHNLPFCFNLLTFGQEYFNPITLKLLQCISQTVNAKVRAQALAAWVVALTLPLGVEPCRAFSLQTIPDGPTKAFLQSIQRMIDASPVLLTLTSLSSSQESTELIFECSSRLRAFRRFMLSDKGWSTQYFGATDIRVPFTLELLAISSNLRAEPSPDDLSSLDKSELRTAIITAAITALQILRSLFGEQPSAIGFVLDGSLEGFILYRFNLIQSSCRLIFKPCQEHLKDLQCLQSLLSQTVDSVRIFNPQLKYTSSELFSELYTFLAHFQDLDSILMDAFKVSARSFLDRAERKRLQRCLPLVISGSPLDEILRNIQCVLLQ